MKAVFGKSALISGTAVPPPSKSYTHRALICGALTHGVLIRNVLLCGDTLCTLDCLEKLGAKYTVTGRDIYIGSFDPFAPRGKTVLDCGESGSTLRFLLPLALLSGDETVFKGAPRLIERVGSTFAPICGAYTSDRSSITVSGGLVPGEQALSADVSSQYISGLILAAAASGKESKIRFSTPAESLSYIKMTADILLGFGVKCEIFSDSVRVHAAKPTRDSDIYIEPDYSAAAALAAFNYIGGSVDVPGLNTMTLQGDAVFPSVFDNILNGKTVDLSNTPDLAPLCFAIAAFCGKGSFSGTRRLKFKETDRASCMACELRKFGISVDVFENAVTLEGALHEPTAILSSHGDHRIVFALSLLCSFTGGTTDNAEAVKKSFPEYFDILKGIGVDVTLTDK